MARYIPALGFRTLTRFYDPLLRITLRDEALKRELVQQCALEADMRVLDVGSGIGKSGNPWARLIAPH